MKERLYRDRKTARLAVASPSIRPSMETGASAYLTSLDRATLAWPGSQRFTLAQCGETTFREWEAELRLPAGDPRANWKLVYLMQAFQAFGTISSEAEILGFGVHGHPLVAYLAARGCEVMAADAERGGLRVEALRSLDSLQRPDICPPEKLFRRVHYTACDPLALLPILYGRYSALWSLDIDRGLRRAEVLRFVQASMVCLRPGGIAVHVFDQVACRTMPGGDRLDRSQIERIALAILADGHEVAQIKFRRDDGEDSGGEYGPFGLILRKEG